MLSPRGPSKYTSILIALLAMPLLSLPAAVAQVDTGTILGTIEDPTGAVVPGVKVTLTNEGTGLAIVTTSGADGTYIFTPIRIGTYTLTVEKEGFQTVSRPHVPLHVTEQVKVDLALSPGQVTQQIEVTGAPPLLETQTSSVGQTQGSQTINNLPLNGRNYTFLAQLGAGATQTSPTGRGLEATGSFIANGLTTVHNNYILDGIDNNNDTVDFLNGAAYANLPPPDAIQEFKVQTSNFSAEFGRAGGAVVNAAVKSGTNNFHGSAWEFLRNDLFDATGLEQWFTPADQKEKGEIRRNQFGVAAGGPIIKNKLFIFGDYEGTRIRQGVEKNPSVPTSAEAASGFLDYRDRFASTTSTSTDLLGRSFNNAKVFDPATTRPATSGQADPTTALTATATGFVRDPFYTGGSIAGMTDFTTAAQQNLMNQLPSTRIDPNALALLQFYPAAGITDFSRPM